MVSERTVGIKDYRNVKLDGYAPSDEILTIPKFLLAQRMKTESFHWFYLNNKGRIIDRIPNEVCVCVCEFTMKKIFACAEIITYPSENFIAREILLCPTQFFHRHNAS